MIKLKPILAKSSTYQKDLLPFIVGATMAAGGKAQKEYEKTVRTWEHKPEFKPTVKITPRTVTLYMTTDDVNWHRVDEGTGMAAGHGGKYPILPGILTGKSKKRALAFSSKSTPKTQPGRLLAAGGKKGKVDTVVKGVMHPGIRPRNWTPLIIANFYPAYEKLITKAVAEFAKSFGR